MIKDTGAKMMTGEALRLGEAKESGITPQRSTMDVRVRFMGDLPAVTGQRETMVTLHDGNTVGDLLACLSKRYGNAFASRVFSGPAKLHHTILIFVNGENIKGLGSLTAELADSEVEVIMLPMFGGG